MAKVYVADSLSDYEGISQKLYIGDEVVIKKDDHDRELSALRLENELLRKQRNDEIKQSYNCYEDESESCRNYIMKMDQAIAKAVEGI